MILDYLIPYIGVGIFIAILSDISIREMKSSTPFTIPELLACILIWPYVIYQLIRGFIEGKF
jgi:hypothetical protein